MHNHLNIEIDALDFRKKLNIKDGLPGKEGKSIEGPQGPKGDPGKSIEGPQGPKGDNGSPDSPDEVVEKVNSSKKKIKAKQIEGLSTLMKESEDRSRNPVGTEAGGGPKYVFRSNGTVISDHVTEINYTTGITAVYSGNGMITLSAAGGGLTELTATGDINSSNKDFTFTEKPDYIVSDGAWYKENVGWTWSGLTATMSVPPNDAIWGFT